MSDRGGAARSVLRRLDRQLVADAGYTPGTEAEDAALVRMLRLLPAGERPVQQFRVGPYRLDFAWPDRRADLEIDGPYHETATGRERDELRDEYLRARGWLIWRVAWYGPGPGGPMGLDLAVVAIATLPRFSFR